MPTSITVVATSTSVSRRRRLHRRRLLRRAHLAVDDADAKLAQLPAAQPLGLDLGRPPCIFSDCSTSGQTT
jgi:hypothetical protein